MTEKEIYEANEIANASKKKVYIAGGMLNRGEQLQRAEERDAIQALGYKTYNPADNKDINDKKKAEQEGLAERIVAQDTDGIVSSDIIVIEPQAHTQGTLVELGQLLGMRDLAVMIQELIEEECFEGDDTHILDKVEELINKVSSKPIYPHLSDIRRHNMPETGDRRSFGVNAYVYGVVLRLTDGKGFYEWDEIMEELAED